MAKISLKDLPKKGSFTTKKTIVTKQKLEKDDWRIAALTDDLQKAVTDYNNRNGNPSEPELISYQGLPSSVFYATAELAIFVKKNKDVKDYVIFHKEKGKKVAWKRWQGKI